MRPKWMPTESKTGITPKSISSLPEASSHHLKMYCQYNRRPFGDFRGKIRAIGAVFSRRVGPITVSCGPEQSIKQKTRNEDASLVPGHDRQRYRLAHHPFGSTPKTLYHLPSAQNSHDNGAGRFGHRIRHCRDLCKLCALRLVCTSLRHCSWVWGYRPYLGQWKRVSVFLSIAEPNIAGQLWLLSIIVRDVHQRRLTPKSSPHTERDEVGGAGLCRASSPLDLAAYDPHARTTSALHQRGA